MNLEKKKLRIASLSSEIAPFSKTGGLADVASSLPRELARIGNEVICVTPLYNEIIDKRLFDLRLDKENVILKIDPENQASVNYWQGKINGEINVYFVEHPFFAETKNIYGSKRENAKFLIFDLAALRLLEEIGFQPEIIQCHDWHTGLVPYYLKKQTQEFAGLEKSATVLTIHNTIFQLGQPWWNIAREKRDDGKSKLPFFNDPKIEEINFLKRGIINADVINTVSETYAEEILEKEKGQDLHILLKNRRERLFGIVNGIDHDDYNPATDPGLAKNYHCGQINRKEINKLWLQKKYGLHENKQIPLIVMSSRIVHQKGFDLILETLEILLRFNVQMVIMGDGDKDYISKITRLNKKYPSKIVWTHFEQKYETSLYAGGDLFLLPSNSEPCGINQMKALRYGCIPVVRSIGGLKDTINNFDFNHRDGNGFTFSTYSPLSLYGAIIRALEYYKNKKIWRELARNSMKISFSWRLPAKLYLELFKKAILFKEEKTTNKEKEDYALD